MLRELSEEIGVDVKEKDLNIGYQPKDVDTPFTAFTVSKWQGEPKSAEESIREVRWFNFDELPFEQMIEENKDWLPSILKVYANRG